MNESFQRTTEELDAMSVDEHDEYSAGLKAEIEALRDLRRAAKEVRDQKVMVANLSARLGVDATGISKEQAQTLIEIAKGTRRRENEVVVTPAPGVLETLNGSPEVAQ